MWFFENIYNQMVQYPWATAADIVLFALLSYAIIAFLRRNNLTRLIKYIMFAVLLCIVLSSPSLHLELAGRVATYICIGIVVVYITTFPQEFRRSILKAGAPKEQQEAYTTQYEVSDERLKETIDEIVRAAQNMSKKDVGALIIIAPNSAPAHILESGTKLDAVLSASLLESIFNTKAPLHDGAVFVRGDRIVAAGCFLPLSQSLDIDKELGTRHRAAIGVTESYNLTAIIVSEETGVISTAQDGELTRYYDSQMLTEKLEQVYGLKAAPVKKSKRQNKTLAEK